MPKAMKAVQTPAHGMRNLNQLSSTMEWGMKNSQRTDSSDEDPTLRAVPEIGEPASNALCSLAVTELAHANGGLDGIVEPINRVKVVVPAVGVGRSARRCSMCFSSTRAARQENVPLPHAIPTFPLQLFPKLSIIPMNLPPAPRARPPSPLLGAPLLLVQPLPRRPIIRGMMMTTDQIAHQS